MTDVIDDGRIMLCSEEANTQAHGVKLQPVPKKPGKDSLSRHSCDVTPVHENVGEIQEPVRSESDQSLYVEVLVLPDDHQVKLQPVPKKPGKDSLSRHSCDVTPVHENVGEIQEPVRSESDQSLYVEVLVLPDDHQVKLQPVPKKPGKDSLSRHSCDVTPVHENVGEIQEPVRSESDQSLYVEVLVLPDDHQVKLQPVPKKPGKDSLSRHSCDVTPVHENVGEIQEPVRSESDQSLYVEVLVLPDDHQHGDDCAAKGTCFSSNLTESGGGLRDKSGLWAGWDDLFDAEQQEDQSRLIAQTVHRIRSGVQLYQRVLFDRGTSMMNFITQINCIADELDKKMKKLRIADITGITVAASGTAAIFAGIALAPVTSGLWLAVSEIGIYGAVSGVVTSVSVAIGKIVKKTLARRKVEKILQSYQTQMVDVEEGLKFIISGMKHLWRLEPGVGADAADILKLMERLENSDVIDALSRNTRVVQAFVADLDSYFTKDSAQRLKKGSGCSFAAKIREVALKLKENIDQLIRIKNMFR